MDLTMVANFVATNDDKERDYLKPILENMLTNTTTPGFS
jgi:hypothetical protein